MRIQIIKISEIYRINKSEEIIAMTDIYRDKAEGRKLSFEPFSFLFSDL